MTAAALAAALFLFVLPASTQARSPRKAPEMGPLPQSVSAERKAEVAPAPARDPFAPDYREGGPAARSPRATAALRPSSKVPKAAATEVVLDAIEVVGTDGHAVDLDAAPSVELVELHDQPQPPCPAEDDPIIEAHVHLADAEAPEESEPMAEARSDTPGIKRLARRLGSLFRPKSAAARVRARDVDLSELLAENFLIPVEGVDRNRLRDSFLDSRGQYARHLAIDIGAPRGTPILATADGEIVKLVRDGRAGIAIHQKDASGRYLFFYCHLSRYARGVSVGQPVAKGEVIGYVGATGRVIGGPHLHFSITRLPEDDDNHREGLAINPYLLFLAGP